MKSTELVAKLLANTTDLDVVQQLVAEDATYVSLNYDDPDLQALEPWCGTHANVGPQAIFETFTNVGRYWEILAFDIYAIFGGSSADSIDTGSHGPEGPAGSDVANVAVYGRFKYKSRTIGRVTDSPFSVWCQVDEQQGKVTYMQFMEDTLDTAASFRKSGKMVYASNPEGDEVTIGED